MAALGVLQTTECVTAQSHTAIGGVWTRVDKGFEICFSGVSSDQCVDAWI
jgi:hypothetical protein